MISEKVHKIIFINLKIIINNQVMSVQDFRQLFSEKAQIDRKNKISLLQKKEYKILTKVFSIKSKINWHF